MAEHSGTAPPIRHARLRSGLSLRELARRIDVSAGTLSAIETGKTPITLDRLHQIAAVLEISVVDLLAADNPVAQPHRSARSGGDWRHFGPLDVDPVLSAAITTFMASGYHGATMRVVAANAEMSVPGVYHHYPSKQRLIVAVLDLAMTELHWRVPAARADGSTPSTRYANMVEALALFHAHRRELAFLGTSEMRSLEEPDRSRIVALRDGIQYLMDDEIAAGITAGEFRTGHPRQAARAVTTMCTSLPQWFRPGGPTSPDEIARQYAQFALTMMRQPD